jgi:hypothetical protein
MLRRVVAILLSIQGFSSALATPIPNHRCNALLASSNPNGAAPTEVQYQLARTPKHLQSISKPGDRIVLNLSPKIAAIPWGLLSPQGQQEFAELLARINPDETLADLAHRFGMSETEIVESAAVDGDALIRQMIHERNQGHWDDVITIYQEKLLGRWKDVAEAKLQVALAYNRRNLTTDRATALRLVQEVIFTNRAVMLLSEAHGILGRIYKDMYSESKDPAMLEIAINTYLQGYMLNPLDYYPGTAALNLILLNEDFNSNRAQTLINMLQVSVKSARQRLAEKNQPEDFWLLSTIFLLHIYKGEWPAATTLLPSLIAHAEGPQNLRAVSDEIKRLLASGSEALGPQTFAWLSDIHGKLEHSRAAPDARLPLIGPSPSYVTNKTFPSTEGVYKASPFDVRSALDESGIADDLEALRPSGTVNIASFHEVLQNKDGHLNNRTRAVLLAPTGPYRDVIQIIADQLDMVPWWQAHGEVGLEMRPEHAEEFLLRILKSGRHIHLLVPKRFRTLHAGSYTLQEFDILLRLFPQYQNQIHFVFGFEHVYPLDYVQRLSPDQVSQKYASNITRFFTWKFAHWLKELDKNVKRYRWH